MPDPVVSYPFDATGQAATNRIVGEQIIVLAPGDRLFHYTMPKFAPFFQEGLSVSIRDLNNNVIPLTLGVDYYLSHKFLDASMATMHPIYGSITFLRRDIVGTLIVTYQTVGDIWTLDTEKITEILMNTTQNPRITSWEQVTDRPIDFPVIDHPWKLDDLVGQKEILEVLNNFYEAYLLSLDPNSGGGGSSIILNHINDQSNPHKVSAAQTGAYSISQIDQILLGYVKNTDSAYNAVRFAGRTWGDAVTEILQGTAANSGQLEGRNYNQLLSELQSTLGDAESINGKNLAAIMADVKSTKVDNATNADTAANSGQLGGQTLQQVLQSVAQVQPEIAGNALKVFNLDQQELAKFIRDSNSFDGSQIVLKDVTPTALNNGGTQDANYSYLYLGQFPMPVVDPNDTTIHYDPTQRNWPASATLSFLRNGVQYRAECEFTLDANQNGDVSVTVSGPFDTSVGAANLPFYIGARKGTEYFALDGVTKGWSTEVYVKFRKDQNFNVLGAFFSSQGSFVTDESLPAQVFDRTNVKLNTVAWRTPVLDLNRSEVQAAFDAVADEITSLIS